MSTPLYPRLGAIAVITGFLLLTRQPAEGRAPQQSLPAQYQPTTATALPVIQAAALTQQAQEAGASQPAPTRPEASKSPKEQAWQMLEKGCAEERTSDRAIAVRVLGLMPNDTRATKLAVKTLNDNKPEVRAAAASALGGMNSRKNIFKLRRALDDKDPEVVLAAAHALDLMHDKSAYGVYYEVVNGQRKTGKGLIASQTSIFSDPKKMAQLGFEEGIGFIPFAGIGWSAIKAITKDDASPVRAAAAKMLAKDPDPATTRVLTDAAGDKSWLVRAAALEALAKRGDPSALEAVKQCMDDESNAVKYTAAAAVLRLTAINEAASARQKETKGSERMKKD